jgi:demethylmenaquinone methyltransferase/2-methoxy-6-polyprenyl-1,4-benzoquinol methylase
LYFETSVPDKTPYKQGYNFYSKTFFHLLVNYFQDNAWIFIRICCCFPYGEALNNILRKVGFIDVVAMPQTLGVANNLCCIKK